MNLRKALFIILGLTAILLITGLCLQHFGIHLSAYNTIDKLGKNRSGLDNTMSNHEAPILLYQDEGHIRMVSIERNNDQQFDCTEEIITQPEGFNFPVKTKNGYEFTVSLVQNHQNEPDIFIAADTLIAISDIDGNFDAFASLLLGNNICDSAFNWTFGQNRLVLLGDVFDRGDEVFECLWLIYKLEQEANDYGGHVHFILGNHEVMNLNGSFHKRDLRYVNKKYYQNEEIVRIPYTDWIGPDSELGRWLRTKNCAEIIGKSLFLHGGISPKVIEYGIDLGLLNELNRQVIDLPPKNRNRLQKLIASSEGPLWYRGMAQGKLEVDELDEVLKQFDIDRVIIGHTINNETKIIPMYDYRVYPIDLDHKKSFERGQISTLFIKDDNQLFQIDNRGKLRSLNG